MKKVLSLVLVIAMVLSSMSFAFASTFEDVTGDYEKAIDTLSALGVIDGYEDGTYRPEKTVTRAEMAKLMVITLGYGDLVAGSKSNFSDTQGHWADAYIALAAGKGIVVGDGNGKFRPDATVSYDEVYTMLVRGLGYTDTCNELKGMSWPTNFKVKAAELDITDDVVMSTTGADRGGVAQAIFNALEATLVTVNSDGDVVKTQDSDEEYVQLLSRLAEKKDITVSADSLDVDSDDYLGNIVDLNQYVYQNITAYLNDDDYVVYVKDSNSVVVEGTVDSIDTATNSFVIEDADDDLFTIDLDDATSLDMFYNGAERSDSITIADIAESFETIKAIGIEDEDDDNGKIDQSPELVGFVVLDRTEVIRVEQEYVDGKDSLDGLQLAIDSSDDVDLTKITVSGDAESLEDIQEDDIVVQYQAIDDEATILVVTRNTVEGKVTKVSDKDTFSIDGTSYDLADHGIIADNGLELGDEGVFYLDQAGDIADYDGESVGPTDYAVVLGTEPGKTELAFSKNSIDEYPQIKLATQDGEEVVYDIEVDINSTTGVSEDSAEAEGKDGVDRAIVNADFTINTTAVDEDFLVKYKLNADNRISDIEVVEDLGVYTYPTEIDLDKSTNTFVSDAVIFDAGDDYAVVSESSLPTDVEAFVVRNSSGEIEVLVAKTGEVDEAADVIFAYIYDTDVTYDDNGDKVQNVDLYTVGADTSVLATDDDIVDTDDVEGVFAIKYDGTAIDLASLVTTTSGILSDEIVFGSSYDSDSTADKIGEVLVGTADTVNAKGGMIEIGTEWYSMSENAAVVTIIDGEADDIADLYDVKADTSNLVVYLNADGDVDLILIIK